MNDIQYNISKKIVLQVIFQAVNNTIDLGYIVLSLQVFEVYSHIYNIDLLTPTII